VPDATHTREDPVMTVDNRHRDTPSAADMQAQAGRFARELGESAQQVWLAGIGALARAQNEGSRLFEQLAEEGRAVGDGQGHAGDSGAAARLEGLRQALDGALGRATAKANEAWDSVGRAFENRVQQALKQMDVPTREDLDALGVRIDALTRELQVRTAASQAAASHAASAAASSAVLGTRSSAESPAALSPGAPAAQAGTTAGATPPSPHPDAGIG